MELLFILLCASLIATRVGVIEEETNNKAEIASNRTKELENQIGELKNLVVDLIKELQERDLIGKN